MKKDSKRLAKYIAEMVAGLCVVLFFGLWFMVVHETHTSRKMLNGTERPLDASGYVFIVILVLLGVMMALYFAYQVANVVLGRWVACGTVVLHLPGEDTAEIIVPRGMRYARLIMLMEANKNRYSGVISVSVLRHGRKVSKSSLHLPVLRPVAVRMPGGMLLDVHVRAVESCERRSKSAYAEDFPCVFWLKQSVLKEDVVSVHCDLESNFQGTFMEEKYPVTGVEKVSFWLVGFRM